MLFIPQYIIPSMKGRKNDYSISFFNEEEKVMFLEFVNDTKLAIKWVNEKGIIWTHGNVYNRRTREFLTRIYPDNIK
jgi:hypothetical protein